ncbi:PTS mannitol transporter subunit IICB [Paenalkalicoccus suaedae]|uniref:PTS system mannitol-specific EIICB component n=1 Tax=Paenalkalicoccus suaedae TaxID=2592382 RepID=A0A859FAB5_9BACI|nr:PTS mannitol transporter subunit IICB [Paenalkalicoccus suaedae]QKS69840.1 PTS mannitol transporter subunit IICB [Paenalkalicoccus suaedae]
MAKEKKNFRTGIQRFGSFLSSMIMPNIGAFIAWGLITALFIEVGWTPNAELAQLVGPMITYLLPLLIAYTGGSIIHGGRGGVVGATAAMGVIVGSEDPMFIGAMIMGPLGGYLIKQIDRVLDGRIKPGFEMLINNFTSGLLALGLTIIAFLGIGPVVYGLTEALGAGVDFIVGLGLLPLVSILVEPAKVLFLNNAINHGVLAPIALNQAADVGKSIIFMVETNPGPGLGILLAYMVFGRGSAKRTAPGAAIIHFVGGIHEIYFPYILMKPALIVAAIAGGMTGIFTFSLFNVGLVSTPAPGSIIAYMAVTPPGDHLGVLAGVFAATIVSFLVASVILKSSKGNEEDEDVNEAVAKMESMKGKKSSVSSSFQSAEGSTNAESTDGPPATPTKSASDINKIIFACDAGMGSSAMGASILKNKVKKAGVDVFVTNTSITNIPDDADVVITHKDLTPRAKEKIATAEHISVENFLNSPEYDKLVDRFK